MQTAQAPKAQNFDVKPGDIYSLGTRHRLMCGDATNKEDVKRLFDGRKPTLVVTSPPYAKQRDYDRPIACWDSLMLGALNGHEFADDVQMLINLGVIHERNEMVEYWQSWKQAMRSQKWRFVAQYVWDKQSGFPGSYGARLAPRHEFIFHFNKKNIIPQKIIKTEPLISNPARFSMRRKDGRTDCREPRRQHAYKMAETVLSVRRVQRGEATGHPAQMPKALVALLIKSWTTAIQVVYDCFAGSGTTMHAAEQESVDSLGMEISPAYTAIALARWAKAYPDQPIKKVATAP